MYVSAVLGHPSIVCSRVSRQLGYASVYVFAGRCCCSMGASSGGTASLAMPCVLICAPCVESSSDSRQPPLFGGRTSLTRMLRAPRSVVASAPPVVPCLGCFMCTQHTADSSINLGAVPGHGIGCAQLQRPPHLLHVVLNMQEWMTASVLLLHTHFLLGALSVWRVAAASKCRGWFWCLLPQQGCPSKLEFQSCRGLHGLNYKDGYAFHPGALHELHVLHNRCGVLLRWVPCWLFTRPLVGRLLARVLQSAGAAVPAQVGVCGFERTLAIREWLCARCITVCHSLRPPLCKCLVSIQHSAPSNTTKGGRGAQM
jgi:hypothetical protein